MESGISEQPITALPPSSIDAERSVLGAMMQDSGAATLAFETLMPVDFYSAEHREIFEAMRALHLSGSPIDLMTVGNELTKRGTLESVGGAPYLLQAVRFVPTTANTRTYIEIVMEKSTLRKLIAASQQIQQQCYAQADPLQDVLHNAERLIFDIVMKRAGAETLVPLNRVLMSTFDQIEELSRLKGRLAGVPTGLYDLDRMLTGLHGGELVLVGARPAMGKTAVALGIAQFAAQKAGKSGFWPLPVLLRVQMFAQALVGAVLVFHAGFIQRAAGLLAEGRDIGLAQPLALGAFFARQRARLGQARQFVDAADGLLVHGLSLL